MEKKIEALVTSVQQDIKKYTDEELSRKPKPDKWSKKEILGHLCDSAVNNLGRFINAQFSKEPFEFSGYNQDEWVRLNNYNDLSINEVLDIFTIFNGRIINVVSGIQPDKLKTRCMVGDKGFRENSGEETLQWLIEDYIEHMRYHINQIV